MEAPYTFRRLESPDTFLMFRIIGKIGINKFAECFDNDAVKSAIAGIADRGDGAASIVGMSVMLELANVIIGNLPECEYEIYQLLSNTSNLSVEQVKSLDFVTFGEMIMDFVMKEEFRDFVKVVSRRFKSAT